MKAYKIFSIIFFLVIFASFSLAAQSCGQSGDAKGFLQTQLRCEQKENYCAKGYSSLGKTYDCKTCCSIGNPEKDSKKNTGSIKSAVGSTCYSKWGESGKGKTKSLNNYAAVYESLYAKQLRACGYTVHLDKDKNILGFKQGTIEYWYGSRPSTYQKNWNK